MILTKSQMRDVIRRNLNQVPPFDSGTGVQGMAPTGYESPTNPQINDAISKAISWINQETGFHAQDISYPVLAQTANGPFILYENLLNWAGFASQTVNSVKRLIWDDGTGNPMALRASDYRDLDIQQVQWQQTPPGTPQLFWMTGYSIYLYPAPSVAGTIRMFVGDAIVSFIADNDRIDQLPEDLQGTITDYATWIICTGPMAGYVEQQQRSETYRRLVFGYPQGNVVGWIEKIRNWKSGQNEEYDFGFQIASYRRGNKAFIHK